jgi:hypothetical protein
LNPFTHDDFLTGRLVASPLSKLPDQPPFSTQDTGILASGGERKNVDAPERVQMQTSRSFKRQLTILFSSALALLLAACGGNYKTVGLNGSSSTSGGATATTNPPPAITSLNPSSVVAGTDAFTLTINGTDFTPASTATWGTTALAATYQSATQLVVAVPASLIAAAGTASVTVSTASGTSPAAALTVNPPAPMIASLNPTLAIAGSTFTLTINGANFTTASTLQLGATALTPTYVSTTQLAAVVPASLVPTAGTMSVTVSTASGTSPAAALTVNPPAPTITSLNPTLAIAGSAFTLTINGANFTAASTSQLGAAALTTTYVSSTQLTAVVPASLVPTAGTMSVTVSTASGTSPAAALTVNPPAPTITSLSSTSTVAGGADFTLTINGSNYLSGTLATVAIWNYTPLATTYVTSTQLTAVVPASLIARSGTVSISVVTAGGTSSGVSFTVNPAQPIINMGMSMTQVPAGYGAFTMSVYGTYFTSTAIVNWGTTPLTPTLVGGFTLTFTVPANLVVTPGKVNVTVTTAGGTSAPVTFTVTPPLPTITSLSPTSVAAGSAAFTLTINGSNFVQGMNTRWGSTWVGANVISSTQLTVLIPATLIATAGTASIQVYTGNGGWSSAVSFAITSAPPTIASLSPSSITAGSAGFMLTITGTAFTPATAAMWGTTSLGTIVVSPTQLTAAVPASLIENSGAGSITVTTASGTSAPAAFTVNPAKPAITSLSPGVATAGGAAFTLTINGVYFTSASASKWGSTALTTTYVSATQLSAAVPARLIAAAGTASVTVSTAAGTSAPAAFTIYPVPRITTATLPSGTAGNAYSGTINVTGGAPGYTWTVTGLPNSLSFFNTSGSTLTIAGTPTASGAISFQVSVQDSVGATAGPVTFTINVAAGASGVNNASLNGSYVCLLQGSIDDDLSRWASILSFQADGHGNFSNGVFDTNSHDIGSASGTMTGSYNIGSDNNGQAAIHTILTNGAAGIQTMQWALALAGTAQPARQFRMVEVDDLGALPSGQQGTANCYLATASAFSASTISGSNFAFGLDGEDNSGNMKAAVGRFSASNGTIIGGNLDSSLGGYATVQTTAFTGSYTVPDPATGRFTIALNGAGRSTGFTVYIIDANRMFILDNTSDDGEQAGNMRVQQQVSYSGANINGPFVLYMRGAEFNSSGTAPSGYYADVFVGTGDGAGNLRINQSYSDNEGVYSAGNSNGGPAALAFDSAHPGRATFTSASGTTYLYLFNTASAFEMTVGDNSSLDSGWLEPQTQIVFTDAALAGNYLFGELPLLNLQPNGYMGEYALSGSGAITAAATTASQGVLSWDQSVTMTYAWDATAPGTGTFLIANGAQGGASCAVINSTKFVCAPQTDPSPSLEVMQQ